MEIGNERVVSIHYTLKDDSGTVLDSSSDGDPLQYIHGAGNIIPGLEGALEGAQPGARLDVQVKAADGYGDRDDSLIMTVDRSAFEGVEAPEVGMRFRGRTNVGEQIFTITGVEGDRVTVDGNHPLAGVDLNFEVEVKEVREATQEELDHGHVH
jgi:FKBP-type peptidyl-prolyl cis-trans isomerase SlyD